MTGKLTPPPGLHTAVQDFRNALDEHGMTWPTNIFRLTDGELEIIIEWSVAWAQHAERGLDAPKLLPFERQSDPAT